MDQPNERQLRLGDAAQCLRAPGPTERANRIPHQSAATGAAIGPLRFNQLHAARWNLEALVIGKTDMLTDRTPTARSAQSGSDEPTRYLSATAEASLRQR